MEKAWNRRHLSADVPVQLNNEIGKDTKCVEESILVPIFKEKGDAGNCTNYRGIKLSHV